MKQKRKQPFIIKILQLCFPKLERFSPSIATWLFQQVFFIPLNHRTPASESEAVAMSEKFIFKLNNKKIQGYAWGQSTQPYVLVIHGWAGRATQFRKFIDPLNQKRFRVIGLDAPAHGQSQGIKTSILEFEAMLIKLFKLKGIPAMVITHSFGGAVALFAISRGLPIQRLINIASPVIPDEIIKTYLRAINGSWATAVRFKEQILKKTGQSFDHFTSFHTAHHLPPNLNLLLIHDEDDNDVLISNALALQQIYPQAILFRTKGLGHTRILKDDSVITRCLQFI